MGNKTRQKKIAKKPIKEEQTISFSLASSIAELHQDSRSPKCDRIGERWYPGHLESQPVTFLFSAV